LASLALDTSEEVPPVTKREKEVLLLLSKGLSSIEIANKIFVTSQTVDSHRKNLLSKFSVNKTVSLLQKAKDMGLLDE
jgi:DNA-binding NarL/FixJ family response regulator